MVNWHTEGDTDGMSDVHRRQVKDEQRKIMVVASRGRLGLDEQMFESMRRNDPYFWEILGLAESNNLSFFQAESLFFEQRRTTREAAMKLKKENFDKRVRHVIFSR